MQSQITLDRRWLFGGSLLILLRVMIVSLLSNNNGAQTGVNSSQEPVAQNSGDHPRSSQGKLSWVKADALNSEAGFFYESEYAGTERQVEVVLPLEKTNVALLPLDSFQTGNLCIFSVVEITAESLQAQAVALLPTEYDGDLNPISFENHPVQWTGSRNLQGPQALSGVMVSDSYLGVEAGGDIYLFPSTNWGYNCQ